MELNDLEFLTSSAGQELLDKYANIKEKELNDLALALSKKGLEHIPSLISLIKLRIKAKDKFTRSEQMFFTSLGFEQSTGENIASYIAGRFGQVGKVVDLTAGIGGNLIFLAKNNRVIAVDQNEVHLECARLNAGAYGVLKNTEFILGRAEDNFIKDADAFFIDPARDREGKSKTRSILNSSPNILAILPELLKTTDKICIKISPAFDYKELDSLPGKPEVEIISEDNVCKVSLLWFGSFKTTERRATCLLGDETFSFVEAVQKKQAPVLEQPLKFLFEPNKAIIKAHLIDELAQRFDLKKINSETAFLTSDVMVSEKKLFRSFEIISIEKFSIKDLKKKFKALGIERADILTRRFPVAVEELYEKLKIGEGGEYVLIFTVLKDNKRYCLLTKRK